MATTLDDLNENARALSDARTHLGTLAQTLNAGLKALKDDQMPEIRAAIETATVAWKALELGIQLHPELFVRPRTVAAHDITFGLEKGKGAINFAYSDEKTCDLIRKKLPALAKTLIAKKEAPVKKAVQRLDAAQLKLIGASICSAGDAVVIRPATSDVDKLVKALVKAELAEGEPE